jgi:cytochrome b subunit of formate dehydrogenase
MSSLKLHPEKAHPANPKNSGGAIRTGLETGQPRLYERFAWTQRVAHALLLVSFTMLGITGLPQKYAQTAWAEAMIRFFGGIDTTRLIHHAFAVIMILLAIYHILDLGYKIFVRRTRLTILPTLKDFRDALQSFLYNIGLRKTRPQMGRYTFEEKVEYWALIWGILIMGLTGFIMWNPIFVTKLLPGEVIPASKAAHGGEALLAVMAIVVWHMYGVHLKRFNKAMWTGKLTEEEMLHEHPLELADIKAGLAERPVDEKTLRRRQKLYYPIAGLLAVIMLLGLYGFVNSEKTAIATVLPIPSEVAIYVPQTPTPLPTLQPAAASAALTGPLTWDGTVSAIFQAKCSMCHGASSATNGLSFASYASTMQGSQDGAVIIPGNVSESKLIAIQSANNHPGQLSAAELAFIKSWIAAGAPEK